MQRVGTNWARRGKRDMFTFGPEPIHPYEPFFLGFFAPSACFSVPRNFRVKEILYRLLGTHIHSDFGLFSGHA
jgi:hypothetical protein